MSVNLQQQQNCFEKIKTLCANYKKDSATRKTHDYLNHRLTTLDALWGDFENQHTVLEEELEDKNINYFLEDIYGKTKAMCETTKADILNLLHKLTEAKSSVKFDLTGLLEEKANNDDVILLLNKQECNFKAIDRAMSKIDIISNNEKWELEDNLNILKSKWSDIDKLHWEIDGVLKGSHETYYNMFVGIESKYDRMRKEISSKLWSTVHYQHSAPRIEIPEFSGSYNQWISFKDLFIESVHSNENFLLELIKNQTSIVELENKVLKKNEANIQAQFDVIENFINQTNLTFARIESAVEIAMATSYFNSAALSAYLLMNNLKNMQEMLFNTLTDVYKGHIDVHLVSPVNLIEQMNFIAGKLPRTISLPVDNIREDIKDLYKLLYVKARVTDRYFLFELHIPLISDEDFTLHRVIPLPVKTAQGTVIVQTSARYIAVNFQKNTYIPFKEDDLQQCVQLKLDNFICNKNLPVYNLHNDNIPCEAKLIGHRTRTPCDVMHTSCKDAWIELHSSNTWLVICCDTCTLRTICEEDVTSHTMTSSGIITLSQGCVLQSKYLTIHSLNQFNSKVKMDYDINVPLITSSINRIANLTYHNIPHQYVSKHQDQNTEEIDRRLLYQKNNEQNFPSVLTTHDIHQYTICYFLLAVAIFAAILWGVGRRYPDFCKLKKQKQCSLQSVKPHYEDIELQPMPEQRNLPRATARPMSSLAQHQSRHQAANDNVTFNLD